MSFMFSSSGRRIMPERPIGVRARMGIRALTPNSNSGSDPDWESGQLADAEGRAQGVQLFEQRNGHRDAVTQVCLVLGVALLAGQEDAVEALHALGAADVARQRIHAFQELSFFPKSLYVDGEDGLAGVGGGGVVGIEV